MDQDGGALVSKPQQMGPSPVIKATSVREVTY
jgi:hypothetical protein